MTASGDKELLLPVALNEAVPVILVTGTEGVGVYYAGIAYAAEKPNEWVRVPGTEGRPGKWVPRDPVPSPKGGQPGASWDERGGHWDIDNGTGNRTRYLPNGTQVDHNNRPIPLSTVGKVGFWTTVGAVTVRVGVAVGRAIAAGAEACAESGACEAIP